MAYSVVLIDSMCKQRHQLRNYATIKRVSRNNYEIECYTRYIIELCDALIQHRWTVRDMHRLLGTNEGSRRTIISGRVGTMLAVDVE